MKQTKKVVFHTDVPNYEGTQMNVRKESIDAKTLEYLGQQFLEPVIKNERVFIKEAVDLFSDTSGRKVSGEILIHEWKSSGTWKHFDLLNYRLTDSDKMPMLIWDCGEVFSDKDDAKQHLLEGFIDYAELALAHTKKLQEALEIEITNAKLLLEEKAQFQNLFN